MTDRELLELIAAQVGTLDKRFNAMDKKIGNIEANMATMQELAEVKEELAGVMGIVVRMENGHGQKLGALFDGYTQNADRLDRIEKIVAKHEETILTKVK